MIKRDGVDGAEVLEVVLVGHVVAVPGDDIEGRVILVGDEEMTLILGNDPEVGNVAVFVPSDGSEEVARVSKSVGTLTIELAYFKLFLFLMNDHLALMVNVVLEPTFIVR